MSTNPKARAWVQVRADALRANYRRVREAAGASAAVLPMVKADAYGLGVVEVVACLAPLNPWGFGVAAVSEGVALREIGVTRPIVVCSPAASDEFAAAVAHDLQLSISSIEALERLQDAARGQGAARGQESGKVKFHIDVDTGMGRSGFDWRTAEEWLPRVVDAAESVCWLGCYTHLHSADEDGESIQEQWSRFDAVLDHAASLRSADGASDPLLIHVLNSAGVFRTPAYARAIVRPGIFLYGGDVGVGQPTPEPVVSLHARVVHVRDVAVGTTLGYGSTYAATEPQRWATLAIGYGDGFPRALGNQGSAIIGGVKVPIIGRISMDVTVVDISDVSTVREGDVATLVGEEGGAHVTLDEIAAQAGTISYEVLTGLTARLPRVWTDRDA
jgi:alanine racemase